MGSIGSYCKCLTQYTCQKQLSSGLVPSFIAADIWPFGCRDLNPLKNNLWLELENMSFQILHRNLETLQIPLVRAASLIPTETVRTANEQSQKC